MKSLDVKKLAENWEYILGGLYYIDESSDEERSCIDLAQGEMKYYINTLSRVLSSAQELISELKLESPEIAFETVPESFQILLKQDIAFLKEDPSEMDESFGSVAMAAFYQYVSRYLKIESDIPFRMKQVLKETVSSEIPKVKIKL